MISDPFRDPGNVIATGYHYVMAVGFEENGKILISNSPEYTSTGGVQVVTLETVKNAREVPGIWKRFEIIS